MQELSPSEKQKAYNKKMWGVVAVLFLLLTFLTCGTCMMMPDDDAANTPIAAENMSNTTETPVAVPEVSGGDLYSTPILPTADDVKRNFNKAASDMDFGFKIRKISVKTGEARNTFSYQFNNYIGIVGDLNKSDNTVSSIIMIASGGDGGMNSGLEILTTIVCLISTVEPGISQAQRTEICKTLGIIDGPDNMADGYEKTATYNNKQYKISMGGGMGVWLTIAHVNS